MIDLGLPSGTKWACCNVGASAPEEFGNYYAWGETSPKGDFDIKTYQYAYYLEDYVMYIFTDIGKDIGGTSHDAATVNWGSPWRMPSLAQIKELTGLKWELEKVGGMNCIKFIGKNGAFLFVPLDSNKFGKGPNTTAEYWSSTSFDSEGYADVMSLDSFSYNYYTWVRRWSGHLVRPVRP